MLHHWRAGPFPDASQSTLSGKSIAVRGNWARVPVFEPDVAAVEVNKHWHRVDRGDMNWLVVRATWAGSTIIQLQFFCLTAHTIGEAVGVSITDLLLRGSRVLNKP